MALSSVDLPLSVGGYDAVAMAAVELEGGVVEQQQTTVGERELGAAEALARLVVVLLLSELPKRALVELDVGLAQVGSGRLGGVVVLADATQRRGWRRGRLRTAEQRPSWGPSVAALASTAAVAAVRCRGRSWRDELDELIADLLTGCGAEATDELESADFGLPLFAAGAEDLVEDGEEFGCRLGGYECEERAGGSLCSLADDVTLVSVELEDGGEGVEEPWLCAERAGSVLAGDLDEDGSGGGSTRRDKRKDETEPRAAKKGGSKPSEGDGVVVVYRRCLKTHRPGWRTRRKKCEVASWRLGHKQAVARPNRNPTLDPPTNRRRGIPHALKGLKGGLPLGPDNVHVRPSVRPSVRGSIQAGVPGAEAQAGDSAQESDRQLGLGASVRAATRCVVFAPLPSPSLLRAAVHFSKKDPPKPTDFRGALEVRVLQDDEIAIGLPIWLFRSARDATLWQFRALLESLEGSSGADPECSFPPPRPGKVAELKASTSRLRAATVSSLILPLLPHLASTLASTLAYAGSPALASAVRRTPPSHGAFVRSRRSHPQGCATSPESLPAHALQLKASAMHAILLTASKQPPRARP
ncbi:hypothetical protein L1887_54783 [Cichorium endivia]|nr:hypothetical protein L1887_54783 [Cichorium endivia]